MFVGGRLKKLTAAFWGWLKGLHLQAETFRDMPPGAFQLLGGKRVLLRDIPDLYTEEFAEMLGCWLNTKRWGLPFAGLGWAEHPARLMDVLSAFERAHNEWENEKMKK